MTAENGGLGVLKEATATLSAADLPPDWRNTFAKQAKKTKATAKPPPRKPVDEDFIRNGDFKQELADMEWRVAGEYAAHPKTDKAVSVSFLAAEDGTPLICAHTTSTALEAGRCYNYFDALAVLKFNGDKEATRAYLADKGYGRFQFKYYCAADLNADDWKLEYLIQDVLVAKQPCIIGGPGKGMKTSITSEMVVSLAAGMPLL